MNLFNKNNYNLRTHKWVTYFSMLVFFVVGLAFFLGTGFFLKEDYEILASPLNEKIDAGEVQDLTINEWIYDEDKKEMRVIIDAQNFIRDYKNVDVSAYERGGNDEAKANIDYEFEENIIVSIKNIDKDYQQMALDISGKKSGDDIDDEDREQEELATLYTDDRTVKIQDINEMTEKEMSVYLTSVMVGQSKKDIENKKNNISKTEDLIRDIDKEIDDIEESKTYKIDDEKVDANNDINSLETKKEEKEKDINSWKEDIEQLTERIDKLHSKQREIEA